MVLIMTRWHEDDLAGRILASDDAASWTVVSLPALAEEGDPLGRQEGAALCPARYDEKALANIRRVLGERDFAALYQQRPMPAEGALFKPTWFKIVDIAPPNRAMVRYWDLAATEAANGARGDYTAGCLIARDADGFFYIMDMRRIQGSPFDVERLIRQTAELDGYDVPIYIEQEGGASGKFVTEHIIRTVVPGWACRAERPTQSKELRAMPLASMAEAGNVRILRGEWNRAFLDELTSFPNGTHDDQVDAASGAFAKLADKDKIWTGRYI